MIEIDKSRRTDFSGSEWRIEFTGCTETLTDRVNITFVPDVVLVLHYATGHWSSWGNEPWTEVRALGIPDGGPPHRVGGCEWRSDATTHPYRTADMPQWLVDLIAEQTGLSLRPFLDLSARPVPRTSSGASTEYRRVAAIQRER